MSDSGNLIAAATVMIVRDTDNGPEVFMVVRHHEIDFASGALVFPGGKVDAGDYASDLRDHCSGTDGLSDHEIAMRIASIRESFEECGILLAREKGQDSFISAARLAELEDWRSRFNKGEADMLSRNKKAWISPSMLWAISPAGLPRK